MNSADIEKKLLKIISSKTSKKPNKQSTLRELGIDSLDLLDIVIEVEEVFEITLEDDLIGNLKNLGDLIREISKRI